MSSEFLGLDRVWYASYGSNLLAERFGYYLSGGSMGQQTVGHIGARDSTPATANRSWKARHELRFGGESRRWDGGGVAFVNAEPGSGECVVRLWLLTAAQFDDVAAQENQMRPGDLVVDHAAVRDVGHLDVVDSWYGRVLWLGDVEGRAVFTFTSPVVRSSSPPARSYLDVVGRGLLECGLTTQEAAEYLHNAAGVDESWTQPEIAELLSDESPESNR